MKDIREDPRRRWPVHYLRRGPPLPYEGTVRLTRAVPRHSRSSSPPVCPSPQPVPDQFVLRDGGRRRPCDFDQRAVPEKPDGGLHRRLRKSRLAGQRLQTDVDRSTLGSEQTCPQDQVDQKRRGRMIVSRQVGQEDVDDVVVDLDVVHIAIVVITPDLLQSAPGPVNNAAPNRGVAMIRGVKFVSVPVADQDRALAFYTDVLGFRLLTDQPFSDKQRWLELGIPGADTRVVLFQFGDTMRPGGILNIALWTDDVEGTAGELKRKGVEFVLEPKRMPYGTMSIFKDVDGNQILLSSR